MISLSQIYQRCTYNNPTVCEIPESPLGLRFPSINTRRHLIPQLAPCPSLSLYNSNRHRTLCTASSSLRVRFPSPSLYYLPLFCEFLLNSPSATDTCLLDAAVTVHLLCCLIWKVLDLKCRVDLIRSVGNCLFLNVVAWSDGVFLLFDWFLDWSESSWCGSVVYYVLICCCELCSHVIGNDFLLAGGK